MPVWQAYRLEAPEAPGAPMNTRSPAFLALSPMGSIPVLVDGDLVLTESMAINLYLARAHGGDLGPRDEPEAGLMAQWTLIGVSSVEGPALAIQAAQGTGAEAGRAEVERQAEALRRPLRAVEAHLARHEWLVGGRFTVADVNLAECLRYAQGHSALMAEVPAVDAWLRRCQARPAFQAMWALREAEPVRG